VIDKTQASRRQRWARVTVIALVVPLLAATVLVWSTTGRDTNLDRIPVAVVNGDTIIQKPQPMAAGRSLTAALTEPDTSSPNLDWKLTDRNDANTGLRDGDYYAVLTIPSDFSKSVVSSGTDHPTQGRLQLTSNGAASSTVPFISQAIADAAATSLGLQTTQGYLGQVYDGFNQIAQSNQQAASSSAELASGTDQLASGAKSLDENTNDLASSLGQLSSGAADLTRGTGSLATGAQDLARGSSQLSVGARELHRGAGDLARSSRTLAGKAGLLADTSGQVARGVGKVAHATERVARGTELVTVNLYVLARVCERAGAGERFCAALTRARDRARRLAGGAVGVSKASAKAAGATHQLAAGAQQLAGGARALARGAGSLDRASGKLADSSARVRDGASTVAQGATQVDDGASSVAEGASAAATGGAQLASGSTSLDSSADSVKKGANQLSRGLAKGASQSPTYSKSQKKALTHVVSEPVVLSNTVQHTHHGNGWLLALILGLVLWFAALLSTSGRDLAHVLRHAAAPVSSGRLTSVQLRPAVGIASIQAVAVLAALPLLNVSTASASPLALLTLLAAAVFTLVALTLRWVLGWFGVAAFVMLLIVQAAALGNVIPIETAPRILQTLNGLLPLTAYVNAASQLVTGGHVGSLSSVVLVLLAWGLASSLAAVLVVRRGRLTPARPASVSPVG
jgi:putative membrane protein